MVVFDCRPFRHALFVQHLSSHSQDVVLSFDVIMTRHGHVPSMLSWGSAKRPSLDAPRRVCVRGVVVSFDHDVRTCRHAVGKLFLKPHPSGNRDLDGSAVGAEA